MNIMCISCVFTKLLRLCKSILFVDHYSLITTSIPVTETGGVSADSISLARIVVTVNKSVTLFLCKVILTNTGSELFRTNVFIMTCVTPE